MNTTGLIILAICLALAAVIVVMVLLSLSRGGSQASGNGTATAPSGGSVNLGGIIKPILALIAVIATVMFVIWIVSLAHAAWDPRQGVTTGTATHRASPLRAIVPSTAQDPVSASRETLDAILAERARIESEEHVLTFRYGDPKEWIHVPDGGFVTNFTSDDNKVVGTQCSWHEGKPPDDATGPEYECHPGIVAHWVRFSAWSEDEDRVTVHYRFKYAF